MLTIRLMRFGRKHQPFFRLVVVPKRGKHDRAKYVESVGWVDPLHHKNSVNAERVKYWMSVGAQPSATAWNLFVKEGILSDKKRPVHKHAVPEVKEPETTAPVVEAPIAGTEEELKKEQVSEVSQEAKLVSAEPEITDSPVDTVEKE